MENRGERRTFRFAVQEIEVTMTSANYEVGATSIDAALRRAWRGDSDHREVILETSLSRQIEEVEDADNPFDPISIELDPDGCWVYLLWGAEPDRPLYVGKSANYLSRLGDHASSRKKRPHIKRVDLIRCADDLAMCHLEDELIAKYQPPWNTQGITDVDELIRRYGEPTLIVGAQTMAAETS